MLSANRQAASQRGSADLNENFHSKYCLGNVFRSRFVRSLCLQSSARHLICLHQIIDLFRETIRAEPRESTQPPQWSKRTLRLRNNSSLLLCCLSACDRTRSLMLLQHLPLRIRASYSVPLNVMLSLPPLLLVPISGPQWPEMSGDENIRTENAATNYSPDPSDCIQFKLLSL